MNVKVLTAKLALVCLLLFSCFYGIGQSLIISPTGSTCAQNGELSWTLSGADPGTELYTITDANSGIVIAGPITANMLSGLPPGDYDVQASFQVGGVDMVISEMATIVDDFEELMFNFSIVKGCDDSVIFTETAGMIATVEVLAGPTMVGTLFMGNTATGLDAGMYQFELTDICGNTQIVDVEIPADNPLTRIDFNSDCNIDAACGEIEIFIGRFAFTSAQLSCSNFDYTISYTDPITMTPTTITGMSPSTAGFNVTMPWFCGEVYDVTVELVDCCGDTWSRTKTVNAVPSAVVVNDPMSCTGCFDILLNNIRGPIDIAFTSSPGDPATGSDMAAFNASYPIPMDCSISVGSTIPFWTTYSICRMTPNIDPGMYTIEVTDMCGKTTEHMLDVPVRDLGIARAAAVYYCDEDSTSLIIRTNLPVQTVTVTSFPPTFTDDPDLSDCIGPGSPNTNNANGSSIPLGPFPDGIYSFEIVGVCGQIETLDIELNIPQVEITFDPATDITPGCNTFDVSYFVTDAPALAPELIILEWFNPVTMAWEAIDQIGGMASGPSSGTFVDVTETGLFRFVVLVSTVKESCFETLTEFTYDDDGLDFSSLQAIQCTDGTFFVEANANGVIPINYAILDAGGNVLVNNGINPLFTGLAAGSYIFQASNECASEVREIELVAADDLFITSNVCNIGEDGTLSVPNFSFLNYVWFDENAIVVGTGPVLNFSPVTAGDFGQYTVNIADDLGISGSSICVDQTLMIDLGTSCVANAGSW